MREKLRFDLHTHSAYSDGVLTVQQLCRLARKTGLRGIALTDHDTMEGIAAAREAAGQNGLALIPGVEISTAYRGVSVHILGYGVREDDPDLTQFLNSFRIEKLGRAQQILEKLAGMGMPLSLEDLSCQSLDNLGRAHIARAMAAKGYVKTVEEAFACYLLSGRPAYVPKIKAETDEAIRQLKRAGAVAVLAHPEQILLDRDTLFSSLSAWITCGLNGIEAYHPSHDVRQGRYWEAFARAHGLLVTGGSDFHEEPPKGRQHGSLGSSLARWGSYPKDITTLLEYIGCNDE